MKKLNREEAVAIAGEELVRKVEADSCDFTNRVTNDGTVEFAASVSFEDAEGYDCTLTAYYYQDADAINVEDLSDLDWTIDHYTIG